MNIVLLGPPGTGKGTIAQFISERFGCVHVSTGDLLREQVARKTDTGKKIEPIMNSGQLVSDEIVLNVLKLKLSGIGTRFILDGFPRTLEQGELLEPILSELDISLNVVLEIYSSDDIIVKRLSARRQCTLCKRIYGLDVPSKEPGICDDCQGSTILRDDDKPDVVMKRLKLYKDVTEPLVDFYTKKGLLVKIDGNRYLQEIFKGVEKVLHEFE
ncbi:MAG: adenylate kinase [Candidatus Diapherotrites archaeon CG11_big_fil_rev_8_21_14_0_20_37_9]|nr:MAG: adenylate kinase [Candidatus Diapherotrites archaeon CG11_big_fil_rev_8_21_14_0_20_37_9]